MKIDYLVKYDWGILMLILLNDGYIKVVSLLSCVEKWWTLANEQLILSCEITIKNDKVGV